MTSGVLFWVWLCFIGLALFFLVMACGAWMSLNRESQQAWMSWQRRLKRHDGDMSVSPEFFIRTYKRVYAPRGFAYAGIFLAGTALFTPFLFFLLKHVWSFIWRLQGRLPWMSEGSFMSHFFVYFTLIALWVIFAFLMARAYYQKAPASFKEELTKTQPEPHVTPYKT